MRKIMFAFFASLFLASLFVLPNTYGAFRAGINNTTNTVASGFFTCQAAVRSAAATLALPLTDDSRAAGANDVSVSNTDGTYSLLGVTYNQPGPCPRDGVSGSESITLDGAAGAAYGPNIATNPTTVTVQIWFRTNTTQGGKLIGLGNSQTGSSGNYDRHLYMANNGQVLFGVYPNVVKTVISPAAYNDNAWHQATGTLAPATSANPGLRLYIDGTLVASDPTTVTPQNYAGYVRIGYDNMSGWPSQPTSPYFRGSLAWGSLYTSALTPAQILTTYQAGV